VWNLPTFREAYRKRRCIVPVDGFFEWKAIKGARAKQPYAIAMKDGSPFGIAGLWENWRMTILLSWTQLSWPRMQLELHVAVRGLCGKPDGPVHFKKIEAV
jgi:putative SOS response-associated peptidase YedK